MTSSSATWTDDVNDRIGATLDLSAHALLPTGDASDDVLGSIRSAAQGGKRLRAQLLLASHEAHRGRYPHSAVGVAAALELFQTAALLHDDVLDDSDLRRGRPTAHRTLAALHAAGDWQGSSTQFGAAGAILAGDVALMASHRALATAVAELPLPPAHLVPQLFADMAELVTGGQYLDMKIAVQPLEALAHQEPDIRATMRSKTASYSAEYPLALGAAIAGVGGDALNELREIGVALGIAFQLRDDVLGLTGAPAITGKPAGDDLREGKRTLILLHAWRASSAREQEYLRHVIGNRQATDQDVADAVAAIARTGALDAVEREISSLSTSARSRLVELGLDRDGTDALVHIFDAATSREA